MRAAIVLAVNWPEQRAVVLQEYHFRQTGHRARNASRGTLRSDNDLVDRHAVVRCPALSEEPYPHGHKPQAAISDGGMLNDMKKLRRMRRRGVIHVTTDEEGDARAAAQYHVRQHQRPKPAKTELQHCVTIGDFCDGACERRKIGYGCRIADLCKLGIAEIQGLANIRRDIPIQMSRGVPRSRPWARRRA
jgi:hypothetical protein